MKKTLISLMCVVICLLCTSCPSPHHFIEYDESNICGKLCYIVNPFDLKDTIVCINNVIIHCTMHDKEYCSSVRELLSMYGGEMSDCQSHQSTTLHRWGFLANKEQCFFPTCNGQFISLMNTKKGVMADSINLSYRNVTIYTKQRTKGNNDESKLYMGDFVRFRGNDYMKPKFITDSITTAGERIVCFDGHDGPTWWEPIELQK